MDTAAPVAVPTRETLLARAAALAPVLASRAAAAEAARRCPDETIRDLADNGLLRLCLPARFGGYELGWDVRSEVAQVLARGCGAQAWIMHILTDHQQLVGGFPLEAQEEVWGRDPETRISASLDPTGTARPVPGGYVYSGRQPFSSGIDHVQWVVLGGFVHENGAPAPDRSYFLVPKADGTVIDDWHVLGLCGTGSKSFAVRDIFIPAHRVLAGVHADSGTGPGTAVNRAPVYRMPRFAMAPTGFAAVAVGIAEGFFAEWLAYTGGRKSRGTPVAALMATQMEAGGAFAALAAADAMWLGAARTAMRRLAAGERLEPRQCLETKLRAAYAGRLALDTVQRLFNSAGGRALYASLSLQRRLRDLQAAAAHFSLAFDGAAANFGATLFEPPPA